MKTSAEVVRKALDQVDSERKRTLFMVYALLAMSVAFWVAMIFSENDHKGLPYGLAAVMGSVYVAGMIAAKVSHDNTRVILKAIELLSAETTTQG